MSDCSDILFGGDTVLTISTTPELDHLLNHYQVYKSFIIGEFLTKKWRDNYTDEIGSGNLMNEQQQDRC